METFQVSTDGWVDLKMEYVHTMGYYSILKKEEILRYETTEKKLEDIM